MVGGAVKKRGRPRKPEALKKLASLGFRCPAYLKDWLVASAKFRGLTLSAEVERRLQDSLDGGPPEPPEYLRPYLP